MFENLFALFVAVFTFEEGDAEAFEEVGPPLAAHGAEEDPEEDRAHGTAPGVGDGEGVAAVDDVAGGPGGMGGGEDVAFGVGVVNLKGAVAVVEEAVGNWDDVGEAEALAGGVGVDFFGDGDGVEGGVEEPGAGGVEGLGVEEGGAEVFGGDVGGGGFVPGLDGDGVAGDGAFAFGELGLELVVGGDEVAVDGEEFHGVAVLGGVYSTKEAGGGEVAEFGGEFLADIEDGDGFFRGDLHVELLAYEGGGW